MTDDDLKSILQYKHDPLGFVRRVFPWGTGQLEGHTGPRSWQSDVLQTIGDHFKDPETRFTPMRVAVASGHGIGKTAIIAQITHWAMSTMPDTRVVITANTDGQLKTKTWPEISKWFRLAFNAFWWTPTATSVYSADPASEKSWRADATPWSENNTEAFAGLHNEGRRIVLIMDEASAISDAVWTVAEGALTDENTEILWIAFGNPTRNTCRFRECFRQFRHLWYTAQIDSRTVEGTNKAYLDELVQTYGEDSDIVKIRVRGMFPSSSAKQFISTDRVDAAFGRDLRPEQYEWAPKILTLDPAWEGDDECVFGLRQGLYFRVLEVIAKNDNDLDIAAKLAKYEDEEQADAVFIDAGYGTGVVSAGRAMKRDWQLIWFGGASSKPEYLNKRAEMWGEMRDWLQQGGAIPPDRVLYQDLIGPETVNATGKNLGKIQLESKSDMKARGLPSPGRGDALALSFAMPVVKKALQPVGGMRNSKRTAYDPYGMKR